MKIVSNYKDFYDHALTQHGIDTTIIYKRTNEEHTSIIDNPKVRPRNFEIKYANTRNNSVNWDKADKNDFFTVRNKQYKFNAYNMMYLFLCGKILRIYAASVKTVEGLMESHWFTEEELTEAGLVDNKKVSKYSLLNYFQEYDKSFIEEIILPYIETHNVTHALFKCPNFHRQIDNKFTLIVEEHPNLKFLELDRKFNAYNLAMEIEMYITNVISPKEVPNMVNISDKDRIYQHGFDEKSFRKEKQK